LHFTVTPVTPGANGDAALFTGSGQPAVAADGTLTFTPAPNAHGTAHFSVVLIDNGGTLNAGVDTSAVQTFDIVITKPHIWHNTKNAMDGDGDDKIAPIDALQIINYINACGNVNGGHVPALGSTTCGGGRADYGKPFGYIDISGDDFVAPNDALTVINAINAGQGGEGEAIQESGVGNRESVGDASGDLMTLLAIDVASQSKRRR
jgi:hypothetical protein